VVEGGGQGEGGNGSRNSTAPVTGDENGEEYEIDQKDMAKSMR
jgi:hypothetical protein